MTANAGLLVGWNRPITGREGEATSKFPEYLGYLGKLQSSGQIESYEPVLSKPHGGDLNGFILIRGDTSKFTQIRETDEWKRWESWGNFHMMGFGVISCHLGEAVGDEIARYASFIRR
jgi:hypothetical protein